jgi:hypothetical protein
MWNSTPSDAIASRSVVLISSSANGKIRSPELTTCTSSSPSTLKRQAYSQPMVPPPAIASDRGSRSMCWIVSESYTPGPANGIVEGRRGVEPVAMSMTPASSSLGSVSPSTLTV